MPERVLGLVMVEWLDSVQPLSEWRCWHDMPEMEVVRCFSVGWLVKRNKEVLMLAANVGDLGKANQQGSGVIRIPMKCVIEITKLVMS